MPTNLSPGYFEAERRYRQADSDEERAAALQEMLSTIPKHKGTEKMQADIKSRLSKLKQDLKKGKKQTKQRYDPAHVKRSGAGQVVLVGAPNAGKSALLATLSNARAQVSEAPFSTQTPLPGMVPFDNVQIQLVDAPPVSADYTPGWLGNLVRHADLACLVADAGNDACLENVQAVLEVMLERKVRLVDEPDPESSVLDSVAEVPTLLVVNKMDRPGAKERVEILREFYGDRFEILTVSAETDEPAGSAGTTGTTGTDETAGSAGSAGTTGSDRSDGSHGAQAEGPAAADKTAGEGSATAADVSEGLGALRRRLFERLGVIRVCTKAPGKEPETDTPFVLPAGATVGDLARAIHKDLEARMSYARIWGTGKFDGQRVPRDHVLSDMDVVEIHT
jgi:hypothetical protein